MRIALTGASGLVGSALQKRLRAQDHEVIPVVRRTPTGAEVGWSIDEQRIVDGAFDDIDAVVHLAGAGIAAWPWTDKYKRAIVSSRTIGTGLVAWIHIDDEVGAIMHLLRNQLAGAFNLTSPNPVTYRELNTTMGNVMNRPSSLPIPDFGPKLLLGTELTDSLLFTGQSTSSICQRQT